MKRKLGRLVLLLFLLLPVLTVSVHADMGPKPSVVVDFVGIERDSGAPFYVTLLAEEQSTGPYSWSGILNAGLSPEDAADEIFQKFDGYQDPDGYYFLGYYEECSESGQFIWGYHPPLRFKILLYFPESDCFVVSPEICEQYAFDSYFAAELHDDGEWMEVRRTYHRGWQIGAFLVRLLLTIGVEVLLALAFGFREKRQLLVILGANVVTQVILNIVLLKGGAVPLFFFYVIQYGLLELGIFLAEALIYARCLPKLAAPYSTKRKPVLYALTANLVSFCLGYGISNMFPQFF